ncbi:T9SS type A sorting domain-containing protein [Hymenobacter sp. BT491]|uniref:T9SS type A sorting domain-containing protein n=1 Tax=Hymenobacter sp. BT491 TaxID=2766779 RepID=UPI001653ABCB|nr:T9SS type A sorting domain-containing protein [Hymenobacter sp. BT491]MBC6988872.1 T9SS type A sorting domain-containing protein [Hymenobacter sp. BT491]
MCFFIAKAQVPTNSFAVTSACPAADNNPSVLQKINVGGSLTPIGTIAEGGTPLMINALGFDVANQNVLYGMNVVIPTSFTDLNTPPNLYSISLTNAAATRLGPVTPPPAPAPTFGFFTSSIGFSQTFNFIGDGDRNSNYYVGAVTLRYSFPTSDILNLPSPSGVVSEVKLYVGVISLAGISSASPPAPVWHQLNTSDPATAAVISNYTTQVQTFIRSNGTTAVPDGGIQDWVYIPSTGNLVSYLGIEDKLLTISNPAVLPVATTTTPTTPIPTAQNIGAMFTDRFENVYAVDADGGTIYKIDHVFGNFSGESYGAAFGCSRGDAVSFAGALPLPVELTSFTAQSKPNRVALAWTTASEKDAASFVVERSTDGTKWQPVVTVAATNSSTGHRYTAQDEAPVPGRSYYRLAMLDQDGTVTYSSVQPVDCAAVSARIATLYPNPTQAGFRMLLTAPTTEPSRVQIVNSTGQVVWQENVASGTSTVQVQNMGLPAGLYYVRFSDKAQSQKLVITAK